MRHGEVSINVAMMSCDRVCQWLLAMAVLEEWSDVVQPDAISITAGLQVLKMGYTMIQVRHNNVAI